jgi:hypothetical protein
MAIALSDVSGALKTVLLPYIRDNFPKQTILLDQIKRNSGTQFMNNNFYVPLRTSRNTGVVNLASDTSTLRNGAATIGQASAAVKTATGTFEISKLAIAATKNQKGAVEPMLQFQADALMTDFSRSVNRQFMGDGSGVIAKINGAGTAAGTAISVTSVNPVNGDISAVKYIAAGAVLSFGTAIGTVSSVLDGGSVGTVNLTSSITPGGTGSSIVLVDGDNVAAAEFAGIDLIIGTGGTFEGLARATTPQWQGQLGTLAGGTLTLNGMTRKHLQAAEFAMSGDRYALFANQTPYNAYGNLLVAYRRDVNTQQLIGGWSGLEFAVGQKPIGLFLDYDTTEGRVSGVNLDSLTIGEVEPMNWEEDPTSGQPLLRRVDKITYQAVMVYFAQLIGLAPGANWKLTGIVG